MSQNSTLYILMSHSFIRAFSIFILLFYLHHQLIQFYEPSTFMVCCLQTVILDELIIYSQQLLIHKSISNATNSTRSMNRSCLSCKSETIHLMIVPNRETNSIWGTQCRINAPSQLHISNIVDFKSKWVNNSFIYPQPKFGE